MGAPEIGALILRVGACPQKEELDGGARGSGDGGFPGLWTRAPVRAPRARTVPSRMLRVWGGPKCRAALVPRDNFCPQTREAVQAGGVVTVKDKGPEGSDFLGAVAPWASSMGPGSTMHSLLPRSSPMGAPSERKPGPRVCREILLLTAGKYCCPLQDGANNLQFPVLDARTWEEALPALCQLSRPCSRLPSPQSAPSDLGQEDTGSRGHEKSSFCPAPPPPPGRPRGLQLPCDHDRDGDRVPLASQKPGPAKQRHLCPSRLGLSSLPPGPENWVWAEDLAFFPAAVPWRPEHQIQRLQVTRKLLETEEQAAFALGGATPHYLYLASNRSNKWGHPQGYRVQTLGPAGELLPPNSSMGGAFSWVWIKAQAPHQAQIWKEVRVTVLSRSGCGLWQLRHTHRLGQGDQCNDFVDVLNAARRYCVAVTQRKEGEPSSSSICNLNDPWTPTVDVSDFSGNETIAGQYLVAWVTAGFLHIPHAEDVPNTVTAGNGVGFFLRPYNFFDEDPSFRSADSVYFQGGQDAGACKLNPLACLTPATACAPGLPAFSHGDFSHN
ncbi:Membrane primary amine oxidase [Heterocephalus glaber]|uniref:Amine oxidase n=1 Tax=Heterocephalus glaber TaxID=10181 RepID=G5BAI9_HETGA|nr:Membrane primary amine oxidase [Heterocephalus glaber]